MAAAPAVPAESAPECFLLTADTLVLTILQRYRASRKDKSEKQAMVEEVEIATAVA